MTLTVTAAELSKSFAPIIARSHRASLVTLYLVVR
jgi:hypothetical protein